VGRVVSGTRGDPRSRSESVIQMIQDWEVKYPFRGKGGLRHPKNDTTLTPNPRQLRKLNHNY
jgi:hypothetical protein